MTFGGSDRGTGIRSANVFPCQPNPLKRSHFGKLTVEVEHDVFLPDDYPEEWAERYYSEQYVLAAWLLGAEGRYRVTLPAHWVSRNRERLGLDAIADSFGCPRERFEGCSFWIEKTG